MSQSAAMWMQLTEATRRLKAGEPIGMPTETVYGLAAPFSNQRALEKIFQLKARPLFDPLIVHIADPGDLRPLVSSVPAFAEKLAQTFWPGPLTLVLPKSSAVLPIITAGLQTVGVRCPKHPLARRLIRSVGEPLAAPSANRFGKTSPTRAEHVHGEWPGGEVFVVDGGQSEIGLESTVIEVSDAKNETDVSILRSGAITEDDLRAVADRWPTPVKIAKRQSVASPGHLEHHYMPEIPLVILPAGSLPLSDALKSRVSSELKTPADHYGVLTLHQDPKLAARELYQQLRILSKPGNQFIALESRRGQQGGLWEAIWDRLTRAATLEISA